MSQYRPQKTTQLSKEKAREEQKWLILDAKGKNLGRFASEVAQILRGKHKPSFTPHVDCGDGVIIINAGEVAVTGSKEARKIYRYYTGAVGGLREIGFRTMRERKPEYILQHAIKGMMPKTKLGKAQLKKLRLFAGEEHSLKAQQPISVNL